MESGPIPGRDSLTSRSGRIGDKTRRFSINSQSNKPRSSLFDNISVVSSPDGGQGRNRAYTNQTGVVFSSKPPVVDATDQIINEVQQEIDRNKGHWFQKVLALNPYHDHAKRIHELLVQAQTEEHERPDTLFNLVIQGDLGGIKERLAYERKISDGSGMFDNDLVRKTDAAGGNVIHAAYLYQKFHIGRWLVENYPHIALEPYSDDCYNIQERCGIIIDQEDMPYTGENILHMAIVRKNLAEVRWILDFYKGHKDSVPRGLERLLLANAVGKFFNRNGDFYCGSYPLHFAACSADTEMFDLILSYASAINYSATESENNDQNIIHAHMLNPYDDNQRLGTNVIFMRDNHGNNCLHLAVVHRLQDMYAHIKKTALNLLEKEIRLSYADLLLSDDDEDVIFLRPLPNNEGFKFGYCPQETELSVPSGRMSAEAYLAWLKRETEEKVEERMELVLNEDFHSPLTLCAASISKINTGRLVDNERELNNGKNNNNSSNNNKDGSSNNTNNKDTNAETDEYYANLYLTEAEKKRDMIQFLIAQMKKGRWVFGPMKCSLLNLEGVEYPYYIDRYKKQDKNGEIPLPVTAKNNMFGLIEWICITDSNLAAKIPEISKIITAKWNRFGYYIFIRRFAVHIVITTLLTVLICLVNTTPSNSANIDSSQEQAVMWVNVLYPVTSFIIFCVAAYELPSMFNYGWDYWGYHTSRVRGAAKFEKLANTIVVVSFISLIINVYARHLSIKQNTNTADTSEVRGDEGIKVSFTICIIAAWLYLYYFLMGFDQTGRFVLVIYRIVSRDVPFFVTFYIVVLIAFGCAISILTNTGNPEAGYGFYHLLMTIFSLIQITVSMQQNGTYNKEVDVSNVPYNLVWVFNAIFTSFYIVVVLMFLNLLIAIINSTYGKLIEYDDALLLMEKYNIMCAMQSSLWMSESDRRSLPQSYSVVVHGRLRDQVFGSGGGMGAQMGAVGTVGGTGGGGMKNDYDENSAPRLDHFNKNDKSAQHAMLSDGGDESVYMDDLIQQNLPPHYAFEMLDEDKSWWGSTETDESEGVDLTKKKVILLLIMPQNDFHEGGSLAVPGSNADSKRIGDMIRKNMDNIDEIIVAMDSHYPTHIAHAIFWKRGIKNLDPYNPNQHPDPFTVISHKDIIEEIWTPLQTDDYLIEWCKYYTKELEKKGRLQLTIWPQHCIIGSNGHAIVPSINDAIQQWATYRARSIKYEMKGKNLYTEMYSVLAAEVEDPTDPATGMDWDLLAELKIADKVLVCGQALSHCVNFTFMDILKHWHTDPAKLHLLKNGCSSVTGFEQVGEHFLDTIAKQGVTVLNCEDVEF